MPQAKSLINYFLDAQRMREKAATTVGKATKSLLLPIGIHHLRTCRHANVLKSRYMSSNAYQAVLNYVTRAPTRDSFSRLYKSLLTRGVHFECGKGGHTRGGIHTST